MTGPASTYQVSVAGGLRVASGPLALVAAHVVGLVARGYRVWVRDPAGGFTAVHPQDDQPQITYYPPPGAAPEAPPWVDRLSALLAELSNTTNQERSNTP